MEQQGQSTEAFTVPATPDTVPAQVGTTTNKVLQRAIERVRARAETGLHAEHTTKHSSHSTHSKGPW